VTTIPTDVSERVSARLRMAKVLIDFNETLAGPQNIQVRESPDGVKSWTHIVSEHNALVNYLLLTCFDLLGQPDQWITFESWLVSRRHMGERKAAEASAPAGATPASVALHLSREHTRLYGAKKSFFRFVNERLTKTARGRLLSSVLIRDAGTTRVGPNIERDKLNFLYDTRNAFTHRAEAEGQYTRAIAPYLATLEGDAVAMSYSQIHREGTVDHSVQAWPFVLYEIVADYIGEAAPRFEIPVRVGVTLDDGRVVWVEGYCYSDLRDAAAIRRRVEMQESIQPKSEEPARPDATCR
jgi:hypothetical protein